MRQRQHQRQPRYLETLCQNVDYINYQKSLGYGTHGEVFERQDYPELAVKIFPNHSGLCKIVNQSEYAIHELISNQLKSELSNFLSLSLSLPLLITDLINIPKVYGFKYLPNVYDPRCCSYEMERIFNVPGGDFKQMIQISPSFPLDYQASMSQGYYVGLDVLFEILNDLNHTHLYHELIYGIGLVYGIFHFKLNLDANDIEFVLGANKNGQIQMFVIDFDKVNRLPTQFPSSLRVKLTESDYDDRVFKEPKQLYRYLATTLHLLPPLTTEEFQIAIQGYQNAAKFYHQENTANLILEFYKRAHNPGFPEQTPS